MWTYEPIMGADEVRAAANRFSKAYLAWTAASSLLGGGVMLQAILNGSPAGVAYAAHDRGGIVLYMLYVRPSQQGRGIGSRLLAAIEAWKPTATCIRLEVLEANAAAIAWYGSKGFVKYGHTEHATGSPDIPAIYMDKALSRYGA